MGGVLFCMWCITIHKETKTKKEEGGGDIEKETWINFFPLLLFRKKRFFICAGSADRVRPTLCMCVCVCSKYTYVCSSFVSLYFFLFIIKMADFALALRFCPVSGKEKKKRVQQRTRGALRTHHREDKREINTFLLHQD